MGVFLFGSRALPASCRAGVAVVVRRLVALAPAGPFSVGCAVGADALALAALLRCAPPAAVRVCAAFAPSGAGSWAGSSVSGVAAAEAAGASVSWLAGGPLALPLAARLSRRSAACLGAAGLAPVRAVAFLASPSSPGSLASCALALGAGASVVAFCAGPWAPDPVPGGSWEPAPAGPWAAAWRLEPLALQPALFA